MLSAVGFAARPRRGGVDARRSCPPPRSASAPGLLALVLLRDSPLGRPSRVPLADALATAGHGVRRPGRSRAPGWGFWLGFMALFTGMTFGVMWGYPFLTVGPGALPRHGAGY